MHFRKIRLKFKSATQITAIWASTIDNDDNNVDDDYDADDDRSDRIYRSQSSIESKMPHCGAMLSSQLNRMIE